MDAKIGVMPIVIKKVKGPCPQGVILATRHPIGKARIGIRTAPDHRRRRFPVGPFAFHAHRKLTRVVKPGLAHANCVPQGLRVRQYQEQPKLVRKDVDDTSRKGRRHIDQCRKEIFRQDKRLLLMRGRRTSRSKHCGSGGYELSALQVSVAFAPDGPREADLPTERLTSEGIR